MTQLLANTKIHHTAFICGLEILNSNWGKMLEMQGQVWVLLLRDSELMLKSQGPIYNR